MKQFKLRFLRTFPTVLKRCITLNPSLPTFSVKRGSSRWAKRQSQWVFCAVPVLESAALPDPVDLLQMLLQTSAIYNRTHQSQPTQADPKSDGPFMCTTLEHLERLFFWFCGKALNQNTFVVVFEHQCVCVNGPPVCLGGGPTVRPSSSSKDPLRRCIINPTDSNIAFFLTKSGSIQQHILRCDKNKTEFPFLWEIVVFEKLCTEKKGYILVHDPRRSCKFSNRGGRCCEGEEVQSLLLPHRRQQTILGQPENKILTRSEGFRYNDQGDLERWGLKHHLQPEREELCGWP